MLLLLLLSNSVRPHRWQPTRPCLPWDSPSKNTRVGCHFLLQCMKVKSESEVAQPCTTFHDPMDCSLPGSSSMRCSRQEYWSGLPLPSLLSFLVFIKFQNMQSNVKRWPCDGDFPLLPGSEGSKLSKGICMLSNWGSNVRCLKTFRKDWERWNTSSFL